MGTRIFFGTNRKLKDLSKPTEAFGHDFSSDGLADLRFGQAMVDDSGEVTEVQVLPNSPADGSKALLLELKEKMFSEKRPTFIYVHGYNTNWKDACKGAANLKRAYAHLNPNVFLLSWPSDGIMGPKNIQEYHDDRHDAEASGRAMFRGMMKLYDFLSSNKPKCGQKIVLFTHSMGNYVLSNAIKAMASEMPAGGNIPRLFDIIISAAADEDSDAFVADRGPVRGQGPWVRIGELCGQMVIYFNKNDTALWGSENTKGNADRMGKHGPSRPFEIPANVSVVDVSKLDPLLDFVGHGYYDTWKGVINDITQVIQGKEPHEVDGRNYIPDKNKYCIG